jgi:ribosomal protein S18 acetylase RimI-like enzyme
MRSRKREEATLNILFEPARPADAEALVKIQVAAFHNDALIYPGVEIGGPPGYDAVESVLKKIDEDDYFKVVVDGQIVGGIVVFDMGRGHFHLDLIYLDPEYHDRGIGTQAMQFIEQQYDAPLWTVDTPAYAVRNQHFYEKFGYVKVGEVEEPGGILLFSYEKHP